MVFFGPADVGPDIARLALAAMCPPALVRAETSPYWREVMALPVVPEYRAPAPAAPPPPDVYAGIKIELADEGVDSSGHWYQTFRATIRPGGTLSDVAVAIYNDYTRVNDVFQAAKRKNPALVDAAHVFVGQEIDITIDPATVFVYKDTTTEQNGAVRKIAYYNGVVETYYNDPQLGILRTVEFPPEARTQSFVFPDDFRGKPEQVEAKPGVKLVDYRYVAGESLSDVVRKVYGVQSARAATDLVAQTGWDPNQWPPAQTQVRVMVNTLVPYVDQRPEVLDYVPAAAAARDKWNALTGERESSGIYPLRMERDGIVYQVEVGASSMTAKKVSGLLFNNPDQFLTVVKAAGIEPPSTDPAIIE